jgi:hypothetical protein
MKGAAIVLAGVLLLVPRPAVAADRIALASLVAASVADAVTTERALQRTPGAYEANPLLHGSAVQRESTKALTTAALVWGLARVGERHPRLATVLAWTAAGSLAALARHNAQIGGR